MLLFSFFYIIGKIYRAQIRRHKKKSSMIDFHMSVIYGKCGGTEINFLFSSWENRTFFRISKKTQNGFYVSFCVMNFVGQKKNFLELKRRKYLCWKWLERKVLFLDENFSINCQLVLELVLKIWWKLIACHGKF